MSNQITAVIVTYNNQDTIQNCLKSLRQNGINNCVVVDNASGDKTVEIIKQNFPGIHLILNKENVGFSKSVNLALAERTSDVLLLNPDTILHENAVSALLSAAQIDDIAAVGPLTMFADSSIQPSFGRFPTVSRIIFDRILLINVRWPISVITRVLGQYKNAHSVDWISGSCMFISSNALKIVGGFDENIFMYGEDVDWCYRANQKGFKILFEPSAKITHYLEGNKMTRYPAKYVNNRRGFLYFFSKHNLPVQEYLYRVVLLGESLLRLSFSLHRPVWRTAYLKTIRLAIGELTN